MLNGPRNPSSIGMDFKLVLNRPLGHRLPAGSKGISLVHDPVPGCPPAVPLDQQAGFRLLSIRIDPPSSHRLRKLGPGCP